ncbi:MAG: hypothetical protein RL248_258 [Pseudomonadota bacterium]
MNDKSQITVFANVVRPNGLEPSTPTMSRWCSNQLSYGRTLSSLVDAIALLAVFYPRHLIFVDLDQFAGLLQL